MNLHPPKIHVEILMPDVMRLGGGVFRRCLSHEGGAFMSGNNAVK